jgi:diguanylate cyclase (GGDEF)-like protein
MLGGTVIDPASIDASQRQLEPTRFQIPESELTPAVSATLSALLKEISRLELTLQRTEARLEELLRSADQDILLPVLNRRALMREVGRFIAFAKRYGSQSSLLYLDINGFKAINDSHGHSAGDLVLRQFCEFLAEKIRGSDVLARVGGDEFAIILPAVSEAQAYRKGSLLAQCLATRPAFWNGCSIPVSFSWGACDLRAELSADAALVEADRNMYVTKRKAKSAMAAG